MKYKEYIDETAIETGINSSKTKKYDWDTFYKNKINTKSVKLINDKVSSFHWKVYMTLNSYFLVDENNEYLGHIEFIFIDKKIIKILESNSEIKSGFYAIMFNIILSNNINEILSDNKLSTQAIKSYKKLKIDKTNQYFNIKVKINNEYFDDLSLIKSNGAIFSVTEKYNGNIKECWNEFYRRYENINEITGKRSSWGNDFEIRSKNINNIMFLTDIEI